MSRPNTTTLALQKLASSGLTPQDAKRLGIVHLAPDRFVKLFPDKPPVPALKLVYHDLDGKARTDTYRVRVLSQPKGTFGEELKLRYLQPPGSPPAAYLPRIINWREVAEDNEVPVLITEGELKAACAAKHGHACIGLGGVSSWRSAKQGWGLLPELAEINWARRQVTIVFDSDVTTNPDVAAAAGLLATELSRRGALPRVAELPALEELGKTGLDDFIVARGAGDFEALLDVAKPDELAQRLWELNQRVAYVYSPGLVYDEARDTSYSHHTFQAAAFSTLWANKQQRDSQGNIKLKQVQVAPEWIKWPHRRQFDRFTYAPGQPKVLEDNSYNQWKGWGCEAKKGSVKPWGELLDHLFLGSEDEARWWFERWCLYPIKHPGVKLKQAAGIWSTYQGVGKSLVGETLGKIYGVNYTAINQKQLESDFNGWAVNKQLVMVDDVSAYDSRSKADVLKTMITQDEVHVNIKFVPTYVLPACVNYYLTSNKPNAFYLEDEDRRFFIHEVKQPMKERAWYDRYYAWLKSDGPSALLYYARHTINFGDFNPNFAPPKTTAKTLMTEAGKSEIELWVRELKDEPEAKLKVGEFKYSRDVFTASELLALFDGSRKGLPVNPAVMGVKLREHFTLANNGVTLKPNGHSERFYIVRNEEAWREASGVTVLKHIREHREQERGAKQGKF